MPTYTAIFRHPNGNIFHPKILNLKNRRPISKKVRGIIICCTHLSRYFSLRKGLTTGNDYNETTLLKNGFPGEYFGNASVIVVKTHRFDK